MAFRVLFDRYPAFDWTAVCDDCPGRPEIDAESRESAADTRRAVRRHVRETGHRVTLMGSTREDYWGEER